MFNASDLFWVSVTALTVDDFIDTHHLVLVDTIIFLTGDTIRLKVIQSDQIVHRWFIILLQKNVLEEAEVLAIQSTDCHLLVNTMLILNLTKIIAWCEEGWAYTSFMKLMTWSYLPYAVRDGWLVVEEPTCIRARFKVAIQNCLIHVFGAKIPENDRLKGCLVSEEHLVNRVKICTMTVMWLD